MAQGEFLRRAAGRIRDLRLAANLTQDELAERAGVKVATYRLFERTGRIAWDRLYRIATVLGRGGELTKLFEPAPFTSIEQLAGPPRRQRSRKRRTTPPAL